jgi:hypothetical protein
LLILASASGGVALIGFTLDDWNAVFAVIGGLSAATIFLVAAGLAKLVGDSAPKKVSSLGRLGAISITLGVATWLFDSYISQGGGRFFIQLSLIYGALLVIGLVQILINAINKRK